MPNFVPFKTVGKSLMNHRTRYSIYTLILANLCIGITAFSQGYEIKAKINGLKDTTIILGHYLNKSMYPDDTARIDKKGYGVFKGDRPLPGGMYLIYLPNTRYFEMILGEDQEFTLETDTVDFIESLSYKGSEENQVFLTFQRFMIVLRKEADSVQALIKSTTVETEKESLYEQARKINETRIAYIEKVASDYPGLFVARFLKATLDINVPDPPRDANGNIIDSTWQYYYFRNHYFDNFDIADPRLLRTPLYEDKVMHYITKVVPQIPDSLIAETDKLIEKSRSDSNLFRYMLITLFNYFGKSNYMGMDAVQIHIADKYYITDSWWSDPKFIADLKERVEITKPLLIGKIAPDIELVEVPAEHFMNAENDTALKKFPHVGKHFRLSQVEAEYLVLVFWEADCGHCKTAIPKLHEIYESSLKSKGIQVLAVNTLFGEEGKVKWVDFVNSHHLYSWMNAWNPYSYDFKVQYDVLTTPQLFILDKNKKIIAKKIAVEQIEDIIKAFRSTN
jgi:thiol-disulfide isomerase/thioredoxin